MQIEEQFDIPMQKGPAQVGVYENARAICNTALLLEAEGAQIPQGKLDSQQATIQIGRAMSGSNSSVVVGDMNMSLSTAQAIQNILGMYHYDVLQHTTALRNMVVTELINEVSNPRNKMHALQLLGRIPEVGLFVERVIPEKAPNHNNEVTERLRQKLRRVVDTKTVDAKLSPDNVAAELAAFVKKV